MWVVFQTGEESWEEKESIVISNYIQGNIHPYFLSPRQAGKAIPNHVRLPNLYDKLSQPQKSDMK